MPQLGSESLKLSSSQKILARTHHYQVESILSVFNSYAMRDRLRNRHRKTNCCFVILKKKLDSGWKWLQACLWACGRGDMSTPSFGSRLNPISTSKGHIMPVLYWCPHQVLKATGAPVPIIYILHICSPSILTRLSWGRFSNICTMQNLHTQIFNAC